MKLRSADKLRFTLTCLAVLASSACRSNPAKELTEEQKRRLIEIHAESAEQYLQMGEIDRAEGQALKGLALDPDSQRLKLIRGWALQRRGKTADILAAERVFRPLLDSGDFRANLGLAESLERKGIAFSEAADAIRSGKRISEAPDPVQRANDLVEESRRAWDESHKQYLVALEKHAGDIDAMNGLARVCALQGLPLESLDWTVQVIEAVRVDREFWEARILRPEISADEETRFRGLLQRSRELEIAAHLHASTVLHELDRDAEAVAHLDAAIQLDPERPEQYSRRAELKHILGQHADAVTDLDQFLSLSTLTFDHPDIRAAWRLRSECQDSLRSARLGE